jgi:hypothetical protein
LKPDAPFDLLDEIERRNIQRIAIEHQNQAPYVKKKPTTRWA